MDEKDIAKTSSQIAAWAEKNRARTSRYYQFLTIRQDVEVAMKDGLPLSVIHGYMTDKGKIDFSYERFRSLVKAHIKIAGTSGRSKEVSPVPNSKPERKSPLSGFQFNPKSKKEELI